MDMHVTKPKQKLPKRCFNSSLKQEEKQRTKGMEMATID